MSPTSASASERPETRLERSRARYRQLLAWLREAIVTNKLGVGASLPSEHDLAARYELSRNVVRRALAELAAEGLVETQPGRGTFVKAPTDAAARAHTLRLATYYPSAHTAKLAAAIRAFEEAHPLIRIRPLRLNPLGYADAVASLIESGQGPDLVLLMNGMFPDLVGGGGDGPFLDLGHVLADDPSLTGDLYPLVMRQFQSEGRQLALPLLFSPVLVAYDQAALRAGGVALPDETWTWTDLLEAARRLTVVGAHGEVERYGFFARPTYTRWPAFVLANGGRLLSSDGSRSALAEPAAVAALEFLVDLMHRHRVAGPVSADLSPEALFVLRRAPLILASLNGADQQQFASSGIEWDVTLVPRATSERRRRHLFQSAGLAVNRHTPHRASALAFLRFLLTRRTQAQFLGAGCSLPVRRSLAEDARLRDPRTHPEHLSLFLRALEENGGEPESFSVEAMQAAHQELLLAFAGLEPVATAATRAAARVDRYLRQTAKVGELATVEGRTT